MEERNNCCVRTSRRLKALKTVLAQNGQHARLVSGRRDDGTTRIGEAPHALPASDIISGVTAKEGEVTKAH